MFGTNVISILYVPWQKTKTTFVMAKMLARHYMGPLSFLKYIVLNARAHIYTCKLLLLAHYVSVSNYVVLYSMCNGRTTPAAARRTISSIGSERSSADQFRLEELSRP